ncbi:hypothetical protein AB9P05_00290 [Roseivirga sp. BDSF3-8]|uniref:hypothetical protein n=1 Tax=Roseivirga sp. BDSF3-8 TaxID=3241598 RepID=UPI0035323999
MMEYLSDLSDAIASYFRHFVQSNFQALWVVLAALAGIYLLTVLLSRIGSPERPYTREHHIRRSSLIASVTVIGLLIAIFSYLWADTDFYVRQPVHFTHWLALVVCMVITIIVLAGMRTRYYRGRISSLVTPAFTPGEGRRFGRNARSLFQKSKLWIIAPAAGFLLLLFALHKPDYLVAVLIDNSTSMETNIENGKLALGETITDLDDNTDVIISWFTDSSGTSVPKTTAAQIQAVSDARQLNGRHAFFEDHNQAIQYLESIELTAKTPLYETIQSQFLFAQNQTMNREYSRRILIIVTDGAESYMDTREVENMLCADESFDLFWDDIGIMNLGGDLNWDFFDMAMNVCNYYVEQDATYLSSYQSGVQEMIREILKKWYFPVFLAITYIVWAVVCLLIRPKAY